MSEDSKAELAVLRVLTNGEPVAHEVIDALRAVGWGPLPTPPANEVREALALAIDPNACEVDAYPWPLNAADRVLAKFEVRPHGPVTDAEVERAAERLWRSEYGYLDEWPDAPVKLRQHFRANARAALEAAQGA